MCIFHFILRPSIFKALLGSAALHLGLMAVTCIWWPQPIDQFSFRGERNAIFVEASFSETAVSDQREVFIEPLEIEPIFDQSELQPTPTIEAEITPRDLMASKAVMTRNDQRAEWPSISFEAGHKTVDSSITVRRENECPNRARLSVQPPSSKSPFPPRQRTADSPSLRSQAEVEQIAGVDDDKSPDFSGNQPPPYPAEAIRRRLEGTVVLRLHIQATGLIQRVEVSKSSGYAILDDVAAAAVSKWKGRPAQRSGRAVATVELLPIRFRLTN